MSKLNTKLSRLTLHSLKRTFYTQQEIVFETLNNAGIINLNRTKQMNTINRSMTTKLLLQLREWESERSLVIIKGAGDKAFCCGGDLKEVRDKDEGPKYCHAIYNLQYLLCKYKIPYIAIIHGLSLGAGFSLFAPGRYRIATERTLIALPETKIGGVPGFGATYYLARLRNNLGLYLALTGDSLEGKDVVAAGIATHYVSSNYLEELQALLSKCTHDDEISALLRKYHMYSNDFRALSNIKHINYCFSATSIEDIIKNLRKVHNYWSEKTLKMLDNMCPGSLRLTLRLLQRGAQLDLEESLQVEHRIVHRCIFSHDFQEGVRAFLLDKDNSPKWKPPTLAEVDDNYVEGFFKKLSQDKELQFFDANL